MTLMRFDHTNPQKSLCSEPFFFKIRTLRKLNLKVDKIFFKKYILMF